MRMKTARDSSHHHKNVVVSIYIYVLLYTQVLYTHCVFVCVSVKFKYLHAEFRVKVCSFLLSVSVFLPIIPQSRLPTDWPISCPLRISVLLLSFIFFCCFILCDQNFISDWRSPLMLLTFDKWGSVLLNSNRMFWDPIQWKETQCLME